jgi:hypothetical protein
VHRVLLVELAVAGRYHRAVQFPYLAGFLDGLGTSWLWLRFAVPAERSQGQDGIALPREDLELLGRSIDEFSPSRVVFNRIPFAALLDLASRCTSENVVHVLGDTTATDVVPPKVQRLDGGLDAWHVLAGVERASGGSTQVVPNFGYEPGNAAARSLQPLPFLVFGEECTYDRPLSSLPAYREVTLSGCVRQGGCAFCNRPPHDSKRRFELEDARRQLASLHRTLPPFEGRLAVRLLGEPAIGHVEQLANIVREMEFPAADWLLDSRADRLAARETALARACDSLEGTGHKIHVALIGVESFVRSDLERMNKGVDPLQNLDAAIALLRLERDHGETFGFRAFGGLSTVFFTPWTTLEDLAFNLRVVQQCGLGDFAAKVLSDRLRLEPRLPITALARHEGLVVERYEDPAFDTASRNFYGTEVPWRFRDRRIEPLSRLFVRLHAASSGAPVDDPLGRRMAALWTEVAKNRFTPLDLALRIIDLMETAYASSAIPSPEAILDAFVRARESAPTLIPGAHQRRKEGEDAHGSDGQPYASAAQLVELCRMGLKPVSKVEPLSSEEVEDILRVLEPPNPQIRTFQSGHGTRAAHLFFGESREKVEAAIRWAAQGEDDPDDGKRDVAVAEAGKLLGYPDCCAEAFAFKETPRSRLSYSWMHLHRRIESPGEVDPILHPWATGLFEAYVPCSLNCPATLKLMHQAEEAMRRVQGDEHVEATQARSRNPWLVVLEGQGSAMELIPESEPGESFRFRVGRRVGWSTDLDRAACADALEIEHERLVLLQEGRPLVDLSMRAFVWWYRRALQASWWTRVLSLRGYLGRDHHGAGRTGLDVDGGLRVGRRLVALGKLLSTALSELGRSGRLGRLRVERLQPVSTAMYSLVLEVDGETLELYVAEATEANPNATRVGPFAIMRPVHQNLDTPVLRAAARVLTAQLKAWVDARHRAKR